MRWVLLQKFKLFSSKFRCFWVRLCIYLDPDPHSEKSADPEREMRIRNWALLTCFHSAPRRLNIGILSISLIKIVREHNFRLYAYQCWGSVTFWCGSDFWLMDPDPTPFFSDFKDAKKFIFFKFFSIIFSFYLPALKINFLLKFYFASIISVCSTPLWEKGRIRIRTSD